MGETGGGGGRLEFDSRVRIDRDWAIDVNDLLVKLLMSEKFCHTVITKKILIFYPFLSVHLYVQF